MATVKAAVKESLLGTTVEPEFSAQTRATFDRNARQDEATGEKYMTEEDFVNAIAPDSENYV
jgi:solute carrier family 25 aspartate/glutamate transporter 12/13